MNMSLMCDGSIIDDNSNFDFLYMQGYKLQVIH